MYSKFKPINNNVLVEIIKNDNKTVSGIIIPDEAQEKSQTGKVINPGKSDQLQVGDTVYYTKHCGISLDDMYLLLREEEVLGILGE